MEEIGQMFNVVENFKNFPKSVKKGVVFLFAAWACFYFVLYKYMLQGNVPEKFSIIAAVICFMSLIKFKWAIIICILTNIMIIFYYIYFITVMSQILMFPDIAVMCFNEVLFFLSAWFLLTKEARQSYKKYAPVTESQSDIKK